jgi:hypothetical protein
VDFALAVDESFLVAIAAQAADSLPLAAALLFAVLAVVGLLIFVHICGRALPNEQPLLLHFAEELLGMRSGLGARSGADKLLDLVPILAELHEPIQELFVLVVTPFPLVEVALVLI